MFQGRTINAGGFQFAYKVMGAYYNSNGGLRLGRSDELHLLRCALASATDSATLNAVSARGWFGEWNRMDDKQGLRRQAAAILP